MAIFRRAQSGDGSLRQSDRSFFADSPMRTVIRSARFYFWPILVLNSTAITIAIGGDPARATLFSIAICLLSSFGFLVNDLWDRDVDYVNQARHFENEPPRTVRIGLGVAILCLVTGMVVASLLGAIEARLASFLAGGLTAYSLLLRRFLVIPTLLCSALSVSPLWAPLILWPRNVRLVHWAFLVATALILAGRETLMDIRDRKGDPVGGRRTLATVFGPAMARSVAGTLLIAGAVILCLVLSLQIIHLGMPDRLATAVSVCPVLGFVLIPAKKAVLGGGKDGADHAAIQGFVIRTRAAMAFLPLLTLFMWRG
jgi:4-hydroxybenzoate polyprenyltransferase